ncbi:MAG TPA: translin family protein [Candidatus Bathyarchaeota archaeon]|nr:MAG: translin family protein [Candidatus Bathyarchaeota archaeon B24-2]HDN62862.1 translin family protein [Candidatus Bathyarchaeota archaeon]
MSLNEFLREIEEKVRELDEARNEAESLSRKIIRETKKSIISTHQESFESSEASLREINRLLKSLREVVQKHPELISNNLVNTAFQETAEAYIYYNLVRWGRFVDPKSMDVSPSQYVLGLADCVGELRRRVLDLIRAGRLKEAEESLKTMEEILYELNLNSDLQVLVPGLRRKCDVARAIIESTRGDLALEVRRKSLEDGIKRLAELLERRRDDV